MNIHCDSAGEHKKQIQDVTDKKRFKMKYMAPNAPQMNGVVGRNIAILKDISKTMIKTVHLSKTNTNFFWFEAVRCANVFYNIATYSFDQKT